MADNQQQEQRNIAVIRKERLDAPRAAGEDPFVITTFDKTHGAREIIENFDRLDGHRQYAPLHHYKQQGQSRYVHSGQQYQNNTD